MLRYNTGLIFTNDKCIGCNRCILECHSNGASICILKDGISKVFVDSRKCSHCGKCISVCTHNAREYLDDTELFFASLASGEKISLLLDPSIYVIYPNEVSKIIGYLKSLGVECVYDVSFGAEISIWANVNYLIQHKKDAPETRAFLSSNCPAVVKFIQLYHPDLLNRLIPVKSPLLCTSTYVKKYLNDTRKFAFLGPCVARKDEIASKSTDSYINYNLTYLHFFEYLKDIDISGFNAESDLKGPGMGDIVSIDGAMKECISFYFPRTELLVKYEGLSEYTMKMLNILSDSSYKENVPLFADVISCHYGCHEGPGVQKDNMDVSKIYSSYMKILNYFLGLYEDVQDYENNRKRLNSRFEKLSPKDFYCDFEDLYMQPYSIPSETIEDIFVSMLKDSPEKRKIDCRSCGYDSCLDMAKAIAYGYNRKENCIHYMNDEMLRRLNTDSLTGLPNRIAFIKNVSKLFKDNVDSKYAICTGDINNFKIINDIGGMEVGDKVLCFVAKVLKDTFGDKAYISNFNGGNFALCFEYTPENMRSIYSITDFDCKSIGIDMPVTMRFGIYLRQNLSESVDNMINYATVSMDKSRSIQKNTYTLFTDEYREQLVHRTLITTQMESAIDNDEFVLFFQPQYSTSSNDLVGAEALCRWIKNDGIMVYPNDFIPISEMNGFIRVLDHIIWEKAFICMRDWLKEGIAPVSLSVNISRISLESDTLIYVIEHLKEKYEIPDNYIHFEITESAYMGEQEKLIERIDKIRGLGFKIAMDDFGSGYSSLNSLKDLPIDIIKLDMGFLRHARNVNKGHVVIESVIDMAKKLHFSTIAEGVETQDQVDFLKSVQCDIIQGYIYSKPIPENLFIELMKKER